MILITGATGLVGSHLLGQLLPTEEKLRAIYRSKSSIEKTEKFLKGQLGKKDKELIKKIEWVCADLTDIPQLTNAFETITHVYHCAGLISYAVSDYQQLRKTNIEGTANVVNIALAKKVKKLCHVSSVAALGSELKKRSITENSPRNNEAPHSNYSISKFGAEMEVWRASQEGLSVVIVNPGIIIGAGMGDWNSGSGQLFTRVNRGLSYYPPLVTGFVAIEDVVDAMIQLMQSKHVNERYILVGENLGFQQVLGEIAKVLKKKPPKKPLKRWMLHLAWASQSIGHSLFGTKKEITRQTVSSIFDQSYYDNKKLQKALNFHYTPVEEAIRETGEKYLAP